MGVDEEIQKANERGRKMRASQPHVVRARYDRGTGQVVLSLSSRLDVAFAARDAEGLEGASAEQLETIEISPSGLGVHFPRLDADLYVPALLEGFLGSKRWMAARMGESGGRSKSVAKAEAARANGRAGGRPRKASAAMVGRS